MFSQWTTLETGELFRLLGTLPERGLAKEEVEKRRRRWGKNLLVTAAPLSLPLLFLNQFKDFMVLILLGATLLAALLGEISDALTILVIVLLN
ncbi:MAG: ATPase, partial [Firmicutes bacterium]|nr:ATPase [Bacillota bacterium]